MVVCGGSNPTDRGTAYMHRIEKVKFGSPVLETFAHNEIPPTLLVLLLKLNKEGSQKKDIWRAPGNQAQVRKLIQVMQHGRLINIANYSVYTVASVLKKFLGKLSGGIFGPDNEQILFDCVEVQNESERRAQINRVISSLVVPAQHLLVLLLGTFRLIADNSDVQGTRMSSEAIGVSVAPSLFHTCILDGHNAQINDVLRFRTASRIVTLLINEFGMPDLLPREVYEFYARITGRQLRLDENLHFTFHEFMECYSQGESGTFHTSRTVAEAACPASTSRQSSDRRSRALSQPEVMSHNNDPDDYAGSSPSCQGGSIQTAMSLEQLKKTNRQTDTSRSLSHLTEVHARQTARMQNRSEWFLSPQLPSKIAADISRQEQDAKNGAQIKEIGATRRRSWRKHYQRPRSNVTDYHQSIEYSLEGRDHQTPSMESISGGGTGKAAASIRRLPSTSSATGIATATVRVRRTNSTRSSNGHSSSASMSAIGGPQAVLTRDSDSVDGSSAYCPVLDSSSSALCSSPPIALLHVDVDASEASASDISPMSAPRTPAPTLADEEEAEERRGEIYDDPFTTDASAS